MKSDGAAIQEGCKHADNVDSEEETSHPLLRLFYGWVSPLLWKGYRLYRREQAMTIDDLLKVPRTERADSCHVRLMKEWQKEMGSANGSDPVAATSPFHDPNGKEQGASSAIKKEPSLAKALFRSNKFDLLISALVMFVNLATVIAQPFVLRGFLNSLGTYVFAQDQNEKWKAYVWAVGLTLMTLLASFCNQTAIYYSSRGFGRMRTALTIAIYEKALQLEGAHRHTGIVAQMHGSDVMKFNDLGMLFPNMITSPFAIIAAVIVLYFFIGWAGLLSIFVLVIIFPFQAVSAGLAIQSRIRYSFLCDSRISLISEVVQGMRIIKFMCWEKEVELRLKQNRAVELVAVRTMLIARSFLLLVISNLPYFLTFAVFGMALGFGESITPQSVFPTLAVLNTLRTPFIFLPLSIAFTTDAFVAVQRIQAFLLSNVRDPYICHEPDTGHPDAISILNTTVQFAYDETTEKVESAKNDSSPEIVDGPLQAAADAKKVTNAAPRKRGVNYTHVFRLLPTKDAMCDVTLRIPKGKLTMIVGPTGSGKSTLIALMAGEAIVREPHHVVLRGRTSLVAQEAWIMNATVRKNIIMNEEFEHTRYIHCINRCQLMSDLQQLAGSDETEIGERGINLSGGQKQRIALARAVYSKCEIVLLDDPLSAVDSHVCAALFEECICGALADRTRVLVTHQTQYLPRADHIIYVQEQRIVFEGVYADFVQKYASIVGTLGHKKESGDIDDDDVEGDMVVPPTTTVMEIPAPRHGSAIITDEQNVSGRINAKVMFWYFKHQSFALVVLTLLFFLAWRFFAVIDDLIISWWAARTPIVGQTLTQIQYFTWYGIFLALSLFFFILRQIPFVFSMLFVARASHDELVTGVLRSPMQFFDQTPVGRIINRFSKDTEMLNVTIPEALNLLYNMVFVVLSVIAIMCYGTPWLSILAALLLVLYMFVIHFYVATNRALKRLEGSSRSPVLAIMNETLGGLPTLRAYCMTRYYSSRHTQRVNDAIRAPYCWRSAQRYLSLRTDTFSSIMGLTTAVLAVILITEVYDREDQLKNIGSIALAVTYSLSLSAIVAFFSQQLAELESQLSSVERVFEYCRLEPEPGYNTVSVVGTFPKSAEIHFDNVWMRYRADTPYVLCGLSFKIAPKKKVGLVGRTGSGKSSLLLALFRMMEIDQGAIRIGGDSISSVSVETLRSAITIIPQDPILFKGSIRSNLDPYYHYTTRQLWEALEQVGMARRIQQDLPAHQLGLEPEESWLESPVEEKGSNFSAGQRQLLCLARAVLKCTSILLLDEATASLDGDSDANVQEVLRKCFPNSTVLTIAHRLRTIIDGDAVIVLKDGHLVEYGTPRELLENPTSQFFSMVAKLGNQKFNELKALAN